MAELARYDLPRVQLLMAEYALKPANAVTFRLEAEVERSTFPEKSKSTLKGTVAKRLFKAWG